MVKVFIVSLLILICTILPACSQPVAITDYKEIECDECLFMAWSTNVDTQGTIQYCYENKCYWTGDSEWGKLHTIIMPSYYHLTIWATDKAGNRTSLEVK
jgi:hypothetical protein